MLKQIRFYRLAADSFPTASAIEDALNKSRFLPCGPTTKKSMGWVPPRGNEYDPLIETIDGQWILRLMVEKKSVPAAQLKKAVEAKCKKIEADTGRKPGRKEKRELKDECELELLPHAFGKTGATTIWIDREAKMLIIGATGQSACDDIVSQLLADLHGVIDGLTVMPADTNKSPSAAMATWLMDYAAPPKFSMDRSLELQAPDESKASVKYARHSLDVGAVREQLEAGLLPKSLGMSWSDQVSFVLGADMTIKKIELIDVQAEGDSAPDSDVDRFDADVTLMTATLRGLLPALAEALGDYSDVS